MAVDVGMTRGRLLGELERLRQRLAELEEVAVERKRAEERIKEENEFLNAVFEGFCRPLYVIDANDYTIKMANSAARQGSLSDSPTCYALTHRGSEPCRQPEHVCPLGEVKKTKKPVVVEHIHYDEDGNASNVEVHGYPIFDDNGDVIQMVEYNLDVAERKLAEQALRESEEKFQELFDEAPVGYHEIDTEGCITRVNRTELEILGYEAKEMLGRPVWEFNLEEEISRQAVLAKTCGDAPPGRAFERTYLRKDGSMVSVLVEDRLLRDAMGRIEGVRSTIQDITERRELEEQLQRAARLEAVGQLAAGVAHQFNNLMTVVNGYSEFVMNALGPHDPMREDVKEIQRAGNRAARLTSQLLSFGRRQMLQMQVVDLSEVLEGMSSDLESVVREDISLELKLGSGLGRVRIDPGHMEQVLMGMVTNSCEAMPTGGVLVIETANAELDAAYAATHEGVKPGEYVMLAISDTGIGMTPEVQKHIFEPFFTTKGMAEGTGLGLAAVYGMVKQIGGSIYVYSEPGQGTTFKVYLPRVDEVPEREEPERPAIEAPGGMETILVVEDNEGVRRLAVNLLGRLGYKVLEAAGGREALELCWTSRERIDLVLTDVVMPDMNGSQLVKRLGDVRPGIKAVYMSGHPDAVIAHQGVRVPESRLVRKPFNIRELAERLREALEEG